MLEKIQKLESFMFWCSGKREGARKSDRLKMKICQCVEEEIELLKKELEELH